MVINSTRDTLQYLDGAIQNGRCSQARHPPKVDRVGSSGLARALNDWGIQRFRHDRGVAPLLRSCEPAARSRRPRPRATPARLAKKRPKTGPPLTHPPPSSRADAKGMLRHGPNHGRSGRPGLSRHAPGFPQPPVAAMRTFGSGPPATDSAPESSLNLPRLNTAALELTIATPP